MRVTPHPSHQQANGPRSTYTHMPIRSMAEPTLLRGKREITAYRSETPSQMGKPATLLDMIRYVDEPPRLAF